MARLSRDKSDRAMAKIHRSSKVKRSSISMLLWANLVTMVLYMISDYEKFIRIGHNLKELLGY